ncbi:MAG: hypothetical protein GKR91_17710 [Pseudomonadales bacterium]|nr:hypothetical protein [Pseudomonadales bacterium]
MKILRWVLGSVVGLVVLLLILQMVASERVEVVELHTLDEQGEEVTTRLWVVDDDGYQYLRVGADGSGWFSRIQANEDFAVTRNDRRFRYTAVLREEKSELINELMQDKYGWGDSLIGTLVGSREASIPIELHLAN